MEGMEKVNEWRRTRGDKKKLGGKIQERKQTGKWKEKWFTLLEKPAGTHSKSRETPQNFNLSRPPDRLPSCINRGSIGKQSKHND